MSSSGKNHRSSNQLNGSIGADPSSCKKARPSNTASDGAAAGTSTGQQGFGSVPFKLPVKQRAVSVTSTGLKLQQLLNSSSGKLLIKSFLSLHD